MASWYGPGFHGNKTANGERYDMHKLTAAHRTLPLGSVAVIRSASTGRQVTVRINDRGPFAKGRVLDLSLAGAQALGMIGHGTDQIELRVVGFQGRTADMGFLRVQIGSFAEHQNALKLLQQAQRVYPGGRIQMIDLPDGQPISGSSRGVYDGVPGGICGHQARIGSIGSALRVSGRRLKS